MAEADPRTALQRLIEERGEDYAGLSRLIGRNAAYVQQYVKRGTPRRLAEEDRRLLARYFGVPEATLGGPDRAEAAPALVRVPQLAVGASAGPGALPSEELPHAHLAFDAGWLRRLVGDAGQLSIIRVEGDSMRPSLSDGDDILIDGSPAARRPRDGIFVLRRDGALLVKRLAVNPAAGRLAILSDNPDYPSWPDCSPADIDLVGRVVWVGRRLP
jgi:phage repressor protein C with HTH and peptisase S24 domain